MRGTSRLIPHGHAWDRADEEVKGGGRPQVYTAGTINGRSLAMEILSLDLSRPRALLKEVFAAPVRPENSSQSRRARRTGSEPWPDNSDRKLDRKLDRNSTATRKDSSRQTSTLTSTDPGTATLTDLDILRRSKRVKNLITIDRVHGSKRRSTWVKNLTKKEVLPKMGKKRGLKGSKIYGSC